VLAQEGPEPHHDHRRKRQEQDDRDDHVDKEAKGCAADRDVRKNVLKKGVHGQRDDEAARAHEDLCELLRELESVHIAVFADGRRRCGRRHLLFCF